MLKRLLLALALGGLAAAPAHADAVVGGIGPRVGFSIDPDQVVFGGQLIIGEIAPDLTFDPSLEFGFGDDVTVIALNFDVHYHFVVAGSNWRPYAGGGIGINFIEFDDDFPGRDDSETEVGGNVILGAGVPTTAGNRFFTELKFGLGDVPTLKMLVGWNFRL
jgi:opacity protein-like surface antigen